MGYVPSGIILIFWILNNNLYHNIHLKLVIEICLTVCWSSTLKNYTNEKYKLRAFQRMSGSCPTPSELREKSIILIPQKTFYFGDLGQPEESFFKGGGLLSFFFRRIWWAA